MSQPTWPSYQVASDEHLKAMGVVAANYNELEYALLALMVPYRQMPTNALKYMFASTGNNFRTTLLLHCIGHSRVSAAASDSVKHFLVGYQICAENRNLIMHSLVADGSDNGDAFFIKAPKNKPLNTVLYRIGIKQLRRTADDIATFSNFGREIHMFIMQSMSRRRPKPPVATLPERPALPLKLSSLQNKS